MTIKFRDTDTDLRANFGSNEVSVDRLLDEFLEILNDNVRLEKENERLERELETVTSIPNSTDYYEEYGISESDFH